MINNLFLISEVKVYQNYAFRNEFMTSGKFINVNGSPI